MGLRNVTNSVWVLLAVMVVSLAASVYFANKSYRSFHVLRNAYELDAPQVGNIRGWMTLDYVAKTYGLDARVLARHLDLAEGTSTAESIRALSLAQNRDSLAFVQRVQEALAHGLTGELTERGDEPAGWLDRLAEDSFAALLRYGYPALAVVLFLGALGVPLPAGPFAVVAGTLALQGEIDAATAFLLSVAASVAGDLAGYGLGRTMSAEFLDRWGPWVGYTRANRQRLECLYARWGGLTLILTRSLVSYIGVIASILAGAGRYALSLFFVFSLIGRLLWTASYFGLGLIAGTDIDVAGGFLGYVSMLLLSGAVLIWSGSALIRHYRAPQAS